jgi:hypothetical protein
MCFFESHPVYDQTQGTGAVFSWLYGYLYHKPPFFFFFFTYTSSMKPNDSLKDFKKLESKLILFWYLKKKKRELESMVPLLLSL